MLKDKNKERKTYFEIVRGWSNKIFGAVFELFLLKNIYIYIHGIYADEFGSVNCNTLCINGDNSEAST